MARRVRSDPYLERMAAIARREVDRGDGNGRERVLAHVAAHAATAIGASPRDVAPAVSGWLDGHLAAETALPRRDALPELLGEVYAGMLTGLRRRRSGSFFTSSDLAARLCACSMPERALRARVFSVCDPAVGGGAFLIAAARLQAASGVRLAAAVAASHGLDTDPLAVAVADTALRLLAAEGGESAAPSIRVGDALSSADALPPAEFDLVVGNPPFLGQLHSDTARTRSLASELRVRFGLPALGYADTAHLFLLVGLEAVREGGGVALILPDSFLATRDAGVIRAAVAERARIRWIWRGGGGLFDASVRVCALGLERGRKTPAGATIRRFAGSHVREVAPLEPGWSRQTGSEPWSWMVADLGGIPATSAAAAAGTMALWCSATADFRDQFYGLVPYVIDDSDDSLSDGGFPRLITVGLIDPARCLWGRRATRLAGRVLQRPRVDLAALQADPAMARWARARLVPKVVLATQTRVLEPTVDDTGAWLPSTPVITVTAHGGVTNWHIAAALSSPVVTARALEWHSGAALSVDAIRLSAKQVLALPAPAPGAAWDLAARNLHAASGARDEAGWRSALLRAAHCSCEAYGFEAEPANALIEWWAARLPPWR